MKFKWLNKTTICFGFSALFSSFIFSEISAQDLTYGQSDIVTYANAASASVLKSGNGITISQIGTQGVTGTPNYTQLNNSNSGLALNNTGNDAITIAATQNISKVVVTCASNSGTASPYVGFNSTVTTMGSAAATVSSCAMFPDISTTYTDVTIQAPANTKFIIFVRGKGCDAAPSNSTTTRISKIEVFLEVSAPSIQASNINFSNVTSNSMTAGWTNGDGQRRAVFLKEEGGIIANPSDGITYNASADWAVKGSELGTSGYYCVYDGTGSSFGLTNLDLSKSYTMQIFEYNGTGVDSKFITTVATDNPRIQAAVLPITISSFKANSQADGVALNWTTSSENNAKKFVVERRSETSDFSLIGEVEASGRGANYLFKDKNVASGETYYYRLKLVDNDAKYAYSELASAKFSIKSAAISSIYPNPAQNSITVTYPATEQSGNLYVLDSKGAVVLKSVIAAKSSQQLLDVASLKAGIYIIKINNGAERVNLKLVKD